MLLAMLALVVCAPSQRAIVAEVYYDAIGDDTGREFVELFNPTAAPVALAGVRLEAGDGSGPGRWTLRWTGTARDTVRAGARFVVGGALVVPAADATVTLDLQNGPDAVRLVWPDGPTEVVGWGAHEFAEYACGAPAPDVASGQSLARVPDDAGLGANALDFRAASPSPGRANLAQRDAALAPGRLTLTPERPNADESARLAGLARNPGTTALAAGEVTVEAWARGAGGDTPTVSVVLGALAPGDSAGFALDLSPLAAGRWTVVARVRLAEDESPEDDADSLVCMAGPCALAVTEIQFHPAAGEGEWVEVRNRSGAPLDLAGFTLSDRGATRARLAGGEGTLAPESLAVVAQDRAALIVRFPTLDPRRVWQGAPWPALNNSDDSSGVADAVAVREDGAPCARVDYSAAGVPAGAPLEWREGAWWPSLAAGGTPLAPPWLPPALPTHFAVEPRRVRAGTAPATFAWELPWPRGTVAIDVYDLAGRRVARVLDDAAVPARGTLAWTPGTLRPGVYVVALRARAPSGGATLTETRALRVDGVEP